MRPELMSASSTIITKPELGAGVIAFRFQRHHGAAGIIGCRGAVFFGRQIARQTDRDRQSTSLMKYSMAEQR